MLIGEERRVGVGTQTESWRKSLDNVTRRSPRKVTRPVCTWVPAPALPGSQRLRLVEVPQRNWRQQEKKRYS